MSKDNSIKPKPSVLWVFVTDGLLVVMLWMLSEWFAKYNHTRLAGFSLFLALETALAGLAFGAYKIWPHLKARLLVTFVFCSICLAFVPFLHSVTPAAIEPKSAAATLTNVQLVLVPPPPSTIAVEPLIFRQKHEGIYILMGKNTIGLPPVPAGEKGFKDIGRAFLGAGTHEHPSQIYLVADENQIVLNIKYAPIFGMPPLELTNNELGGLPSEWDCNHRSNAVEVVNDKLVPVLQVYFKDDTHLVLNGAITFTNGLVKGVVLSAGEGFEIIHNPTLGNNELSQRIAALNLKRLFKYPAWKYPGQFDESESSLDELKTVTKSTVTTGLVETNLNSTVATDSSNAAPSVPSANSVISISQSTNVNVTTVSNINVGPGGVGINQGTLDQGGLGK